MKTEKEIRREVTAEITAKIIGGIIGVGIIAFFIWGIAHAIIVFTRQPLWMIL